MIFDTNTSSQHREPPRAYLTRTASDSCGPPRSFSNSLFIPLLFSVSPLLPDSEPLSPVLLADKKETTNKTATDNFSTFDLRSPSVGRFSTRRPSISWKWFSRNKKRYGRSSIRRGHTIEWKIFVRQITFNIENSGKSRITINSLED